MGKAGTTRRTRLDGASADLYLFCDEIRSRSAIGEMLRRKYSQPISESSLEHILEKLVAAGFMHREGERFLSLATRKAHTVAPRLHRQRVDESLPSGQRARSAHGALHEGRCARVDWTRHVPTELRALGD